MFQVAADYKAAAQIAKLKSKVMRLRRERNDAEKHAAHWLQIEQEKAANANSAATMAATAGVSNGSSWSGVAPVGDDMGDNMNNGGGDRDGRRGVVASLVDRHDRVQRELRGGRPGVERSRGNTQTGNGEGPPPLSASASAAVAGGDVNGYANMDESFSRPPSPDARAASTAVAVADSNGSSQRGLQGNNKISKPNSAGEAAAAAVRNGGTRSVGNESREVPSVSSRSRTQSLAAAAVTGAVLTVEEEPPRSHSGSNNSDSNFALVVQDETVIAVPETVGVTVPEKRNLVAMQGDRTVSASSFAFIRVV